MRARIPAGLVGLSVVSGVSAHAAAAVPAFVSGTAGAMAWWMAAMGAACLACAAPMPRRKHCVGRAAGHLLVMSAAMILIHVVLLTSSGGGGHHGAAMAALPHAGAHADSMLAVIAVQLACLMAASAALRLHGRRRAVLQARP
ncbi:hypothetical protein BIU82_14430 [Arthrobacter sp. SW1]|nr:hypothetical protein BIU82_14430 [Arthrobacter sp. SW1]